MRGANLGTLLRTSDVQPARRRTIIVLGHEATGIPADGLDLLDCAVEIPMIGTGHSLNVAVAGSLTYAAHVSDPRCRQADRDLATYYEARNRYDGTAPAVFLAGGITGCPNWQAEARRELEHLPIAILNPRMADFPIHAPDAAAGQIAWEFEHLRRADVVLFWFPDSGPVVQPIVLYELGVHAASGKPIAVGCDPGYTRRVDVVLQLGHLRPEVVVRDTLGAVCADVCSLLADRPSEAR